MNIKIEVYHFDGNSDKLDKILENQTFIKQQLKQILMAEEQFKAAFARLEKATTDGGLAATAIGARIVKLIEGIKTAGMSEEKEAELLAQTEGLAGNAEALATALTEMGKTPEDPIPAPVPDPLPEARRRQR